MHIWRYEMSPATADLQARLLQPENFRPLAKRGAAQRAAEFTNCLPRFKNTRRVECEGKFLRVNGRRFWIKGVTYGSFGLNEEGEPYPSIEVVRRDFEQMRAAGINTVRLYTPPSERLADAAA